jgi:uncharacterized membrane protein YeaQ/YmgE (transglycosylase-associated protein family)
MQLLEFLVVGIAAGWIMGKIRRGEGYGLIGNLIVGAIGSFIGWFLMGFLKVETPNILAQIAMAVVGAVVFFLAIGLLKRKKKKKEDDDED